MAKFTYDVVELEEYDITTIETFPAKHIAQNYIRNYRRRRDSDLNKKLTWVRVVEIEPNDYVFSPGKKREVTVRDSSTFDIFVQNEQLTYRNCPWGGRANLIWSDEKYDLYHTDKFSGIPKTEGFYLVDNNPRRK